MDWFEIVLTIVGVVLGSVLVYIGANYLKTQNARNRAWKMALIAEQAVLWAQDYFKESSGVEKLKRVVQLIIQKMDEAGWDDVTAPEAEVQARAAYQANIGIKKEMYEKAAQLEAKFKK